MPSVPSLPREIAVVHPIAVLEQAAFGSVVLALAAPGEPLRLFDAGNGFADVQTASGVRGFVPVAACAPNALGSAAALETKHVAQAVTLYGWPVPGWQFAGAPLVYPEQPLRLLGRDGAFALVQREDGELGFVPAALVGVRIPADPHALARVGPVDLGWLVVGSGWFAANWLVLRELEEWLMSPYVPPYFPLLCLLLALCAYLVLLSPRRVAARSLAIGAILGAAWLHLISSGSLTM